MDQQTDARIARTSTLPFRDPKKEKSEKLILGMAQTSDGRTKVNALAHKITNLTQLANEYWSLKDPNNYAKITWKILGRHKSYDANLQQRNLCLKEK